MWFNHIWFLFDLAAAGYPFDKDDLSIEEWQGLGMLKREIEAIKLGDHNAK